MSGRSVHRWRERLRSPLGVRLCWFAVLVIIFLGLSVWLGLEWAALGRATKCAAEGRAELGSLTAASTDLHGLGNRLSDTQAQINAFYAQRFLTNYSSIAQRIGELEVQSGVRLSHVVYVPKSRGSGPAEVVLESDVSGGYSQIMRFVNELERDDAFFVIRSMNLAAQQGGIVNLRIRFSTWLRPVGNGASGIPAVNSRGSGVHPLNTDSNEE